MSDDLDDQKWPTAHALTRRNLSEANAAASRLGHALAAWINEHRIWRAKCTKCGDLATVRPRGLGGSEVGGAATVLNCRG